MRIKCKQSVFAYAVFSVAILLTAYKGNLDWMGIAVIGGVLLPGTRKWLKNIFKRENDVDRLSE